MKPTLVIMAAGIGSRYGGCKQIDPIGPAGEIIIDYSIYDTLRAGFGKLVMIVNSTIEADFRTHIGQRFESQIDTHYVVQDINALPEPFVAPADRIKPWGTGHAVLACRDHVNEPFAVINADDFYGRTTYAVLAEHLATLQDLNAPTYALVAFRLGNTLSDHGTVARGICKVGEDGYLQTVRECLNIERCESGARMQEENHTTTEFTGDEPAWMNFWGFMPHVFEQLQERFLPFIEKHGKDLKSEFLLPVIIDELIGESRAQLTVLHSQERWHGITYQPDKPLVIAAVQSLINEGIYPANLWDKN